MKKNAEVKSDVRKSDLKRLNKNNKIKQTKMKSLVKSVFISLIILVLSCLSLIPLISNMKYGLDLQGGFEILYQVDSIDGEEVTTDMVNNTYQVILKRIDILGVNEPEISIEGNNIRVQLAGVTDEEDAKATLSQMANLTFRNSHDDLVMSSDVLKSGSVKVVADPNSLGNYYLTLDIADVNLFHKKTEEIRKANDVMVIWLDYEDGVNSFDRERESCGTSGTSRCISYASIASELTTDQVTLSGKFTQEEAQKLAELINSGSLPTKLVELSSRTVDASFGKDALEKTYIAGLVGIALIIVFMILIYNFCGLISGIGLTLYTAVVFCLFNMVGGRLTLPGIAAVVIGIGMAVDSAVISFSRIKEELRNKKSLQEAYRNGNKESFASIIDANITTLIAAVILFIFGQSSVKGFATMLIISIIATMFVMVFIIRYLLGLFVNSGIFDKHLTMFIGIRKLNKKPANGKFSFVNKRKLTLFVIPILLIIIGSSSIATQGFNFSIDFKGGTNITLNAKEKLTPSTVKAEIEKLGYEVDSVESISDETVYVTIADVFTTKDNKVVEDYFNKKYKDSNINIGAVSNEVKKALTMNAIKALILACIGIIIYVSIRFQFSYAIASIIALIHDVSFVLIAFSLLQFEISGIFIAAILSIIGYSINDTIVAFDRIRENKEKLYKGQLKKLEDLENLVDVSLRETVGRSLVTSITTIIPVITLLLLGSHEISAFNYALLIGLIAGTYSSLFIAAQIWLVIEKRNVGKKDNKKWYDDDEKEVEELKVKGINC